MSGPIGIAFAWPIMVNHDVIHKRRRTQHTVLSSVEDHFTATVNMHRKWFLRNMGRQT